MSSIPLFIEQAPNHYHLSNEMGHLTRLSTGDTDVDDENEEDDRDDVIDTNEIHLPNDDENCCQRENIDLVMVQQVVESESTRFVNLEDGDRSNNLEVDFKVENTSLVASPHGTQVNISNDNLDATKDENIGHVCPSGTGPEVGIFCWGFESPQQQEEKSSKSSILTVDRLC
ncbi:hypothetical protein CK203_035119 [Vitis vinifera]|uniref:Uncharacterized protein n=1 Tax=Vitis vinifera TaxID=29760 RepID=A0A438I9S9_VITVI|nr:hypothetical protein CK203_035119 [Vitis vinifera]